MRTERIAAAEADAAVRATQERLAREEAEEKVRKAKEEELTPMPVIPAPTIDQDFPPSLVTWTRPSSVVT
jgi:hypothetical protein